MTPDVIDEHTQPTATGYEAKREYRRGTRIPVRHAGAELSVDDLLA